MGFTSEVSCLSGCELSLQQNLASRTASLTISPAFLASPRDRGLLSKEALSATSEKMWGDRVATSSSGGKTILSPHGLVCGIFLGSLGPLGLGIVLSHHNRGFSVEEGSKTGCVKAFDC